MKKILIAAWIISTAVVAVEGAAAPADDAIKQMFARLDRCLADNDAKCVGELLVEDATFATPIGGNKIVNGKAQIVKSLEEMMGPPAATKVPKRTHSVVRLRMIGEDHALVDSSVKVPGTDASLESHHAVVLMTLNGGKWLFEDLRSYVVEHEAAKRKSVPPAKQESAPKANPDAPAANQEPAPPTRK